MITIRQARPEDLTTLITLLWEDPQGRLREDPADTARPDYETAFADIKDDPNTFLLVAVEEDRVIGCAQINVLSGLSYQGIKRALIEDVRITPTRSGKGYGRKLIDAACEYARSEGCKMVELFVHKDRAAAHAFYEKCGFQSMHLGFRKPLDTN